MLTHATDDAGEERVIRLLEDAGHHREDIHVLSHVAHPVDENHSITTVMIVGVNLGMVESWATFRSEDGGNVEKVSQSHGNAAA